VIVRIGEKRIRSSRDLAGAVGALRPSRLVKVEFVRDGTDRTIDVRLGTSG